MLYVIIALFAVAAVIGLLLIKNWLGDKDAPKSMIYVHGALAAAGLVTLLVYAVKSPEHYPLAAIIIFAIAACGGFYLFFANLLKGTRPVAIAAVHALLAVTGFIVLLVFAFK